MNTHFPGCRKEVVAEDNDAFQQIARHSWVLALGILQKAKLSAVRLAGSHNWPLCDAVRSSLGAYKKILIIIMLSSLGLSIYS